LSRFWVEKRTCFGIHGGGWLLGSLRLLRVAVVPLFLLTRFAVIPLFLLTL
jgi:hypothetical protein